MPRISYSPFLILPKLSEKCDTSLSSFPVKYIVLDPLHPEIPTGTSAISHHCYRD